MIPKGWTKTPNGLLIHRCGAAFSEIPPSGCGCLFSDASYKPTTILDTDKKRSDLLTAEALFRLRSGRRQRDSIDPPEDPT